MLLLDHHLARQRLRVRQRLADRMHRPGRHARGIECRQPVGRRLRAQDLGHRGQQGVAVAHAVRVQPIARIGQPLGPAQHLRDPFPVLLVGAPDDDVAVLGRKGLVRCRQHMRRAARARRLAGGEMDRRMPVQLLQSGLDQRGLDDLAASGLLLVLIGGQDADRRQDAGIDIGDRVACAQRRTAFLAGDAHQPGIALRDQVEAALVGGRAGAAIARDRAIDQAGIDLRQHVVAEPELFERALAEVLDQHVGVAHHPQQHLLALGRLQVERDRALVAVQHQEGRRHAVDARIAIAARIVAAVGLLDLDHVGAEVGQHHAAGRAGHDLGQLEHAHAGEGAGLRSAFGLHGGCHRCPFDMVAAQRPWNSGVCLARKAR